MMTVYSPKGNNAGAAVVVFPGGGYYVLAIDLEGTEVCDWLISKGISCVLLKYRVPNSGMHQDGRRQIKPESPYGAGRCPEESGAGPLLCS